MHADLRIAKSNDNDPAPSKRLSSTKTRLLTIWFEDSSEVVYKSCSLIGWELLEKSLLRHMRVTK